MVASAIAPSSTPFINKKDVGLSDFSSQPSFSIQNAKKRVSRKIVAVMAPPQSECSPATIGPVVPVKFTPQMASSAIAPNSTPFINRVKTRMTMTEKILARASEKPQLSGAGGDNIWFDVVLMIHDVGGPRHVWDLQERVWPECKGEEFVVPQALF
ncbi:isopropyl malate isomerase large subunit 1 [Actinidia rufa]|uniref:Isopropyl malate isomerase large subunit 1 n=1 Tax=Actinidia rufa TaxID=165716 RepID=A0A7J0GXR3_9ERIC|nr:isopropyl malate isomerase large subunit 1 [Actinidia rufa]